MPEGPSLVILREESRHFVGKKILRAEGNTKTVDLGALKGKKIVSLRSWGKHFIIELPDGALRIHFMLFGSYRIDERKDSLPRLSLRQLVEQARQYSFDFLEWKKAFVLKKNWLAHRKVICPRCGIPFSKGHLGLTKRRAFFCEHCQKRYG